MMDKYTLNWNVLSVSETWGGFWPARFLLLELDWIRLYVANCRNLTRLFWRLKNISEWSVSLPETTQSQWFACELLSNYVHYPNIYSFTMWLKDHQQIYNPYSLVPPEDTHGVCGAWELSMPPILLWIPLSSKTEWEYCSTEVNFFKHMFVRLLCFYKWLVVVREGSVCLCSNLIINCKTATAEDYTLDIQVSPRCSRW